MRHRVRAGFDATGTTVLRFIMPATGSYMLQQDLAYAAILPIGAGTAFDVSTANMLLFTVNNNEVRLPCRVRHAVHLSVKC